MNIDLFINALLIFIFCGAVIAFVLGCVEGYILYRKGENMDEFPAALPAVAMLNWFYIWYFVKKYIF